MEQFKIALFQACSKTSGKRNVPFIVSHPLYTIIEHTKILRYHASIIFHTDKGKVNHPQI